ncbi:MalY/PatB family protein [Enterococcus columbae]|uniref:cysteine-S-conjugate beta-lyase n=1 Tax=Enterococcus columbae DSM 7374 = ATCC 51263 TaxID=1121865 RepID=S1NEC0_9ENTE|nr:MalY/PatB family protein [Enterococcus columbae]EOT39620.1 hypothetical protein OMW_01817 [Enterococcus columbae DSM 7374 = ATCC 51263]EOW84013.1 hypothetical protein I568_01460 [Enterococcus columbae DSM 7374 = ATCC 51263]OJG25767.1 hypothetical protein RR47_GL001273 [Enterococcus columbae DSM 7374 = ATCC 51263]
MSINEFVEKYQRERCQTNALKWDALAERFGDADLLPLWVADMEFAAPEAVTEALTKRIAHGVFGYSIVDDQYFDTYLGWQKRHENTPFKREWLSFSTGVVQALYDLVDCFTKEGEAVMIQRPVYYPFSNAIKDKNRQLVNSPLVNVDGHYHMDLADFEAKIVENQVKLFILCSPHNPVGRVWTEKELADVLAICQKHQVLVIADEIHSDFIMPGYQFTSAISVANGAYLDQLIVLNAPSKTFNLASLLNSHIWIPNEALRKQYRTWASKNRQTESSMLGQVAAKAAYANGDAWLASLIEVIEANYQTIRTRLAQEAPQVKVGQLEGTYLLWLDLRQAIDENQVKTVIQDKAKLAVDFGSWFDQDSKGFIRLNLATTPAIIHQAIDQLVASL